MVYEMVGTTLHFLQGETYSSEELSAAGCDLAWLEKTATIRPVGFISSGQPRGEMEQAQILAEVQAKLEKAEDALEEERKEHRATKSRVKLLEVGHAHGVAQLNDMTHRAERAEAELKHFKNRESERTETVK